MHSTFSGRAPAARSSLPDQLQHSTPRPTPLLPAPRRRRRPGPRPCRASSRRREHRSPKGLAPRNRHQARQHRKRGPGRTQPAGCRRFRLSASATPAPTPHTHSCRANNPTPDDDPSALQAAVEAAAAALVRRNPTPAPARSPLVSGRWALLYTARARSLRSAAFPTAGRPGLLGQVQLASDRLYKLFYRWACPAPATWVATY